MYVSRGGVKFSYSVPSKVGGKNMLDALDTAPFAPVRTNCENAHERHNTDNQNPTHTCTASPSKLGPAPAFAR